MHGLQSCRSCVKLYERSYRVRCDISKNYREGPRHVQGPAQIQREKQKQRQDPPVRAQRQLGVRSSTPESCDRSK
jgi:hypothetical protein